LTTEADGFAASRSFSSVAGDFRNRSLYGFPRGNCSLECERTCKADRDIRQISQIPSDIENDTYAPSLSQSDLKEIQNTHAICSQTSIESFILSKPKPFQTSDNAWVYLPLEHLCDARYFLRRRLQDISYESDDREHVLAIAKEKYTEWANERTYIVVEKTEHFDDDIEISNFAFLASKRGNSVYVRRLRSKIFKAKQFFKPQFIINPHACSGWTNVLFITCTLDPHICTLGEAWEDVIQHFWNLFISALRKRHGKIAVVRVFAAQDNGYPHVHALLLFCESTFFVKKHLDKNGKTSWRLGSMAGKTEFAEPWVCGNVDVKGVESSRMAVNYMLKYSMAKQNRNVLDQQSLSLAWLYRTQAFSISGPEYMRRSIIQTRILVKIFPEQKNTEKCPFLIEYSILGFIVIQYSDRSPPEFLDFSICPSLSNKVFEVLSLSSRDVDL
jgi:hypothetical protein